MNRFLLNAVQFDGDESVSISYLDSHNDLREGGKVFVTSTLNIDASSRLWPLVLDMRAEIEGILMDGIDLFRGEPPYLPDSVDEDEDDDRGMGF